MKVTSPNITPGKYASGKPFWLVSFSLDGKQQKKKFSIEREANEYKQTIVRKYLGGMSQSSQEEGRLGFEIFRAYQLKNKSLTAVTFEDFVRESCERWQAPVRTDLQSLVDIFLTIKRKQGLRELTLEQLERYLNAFAVAFKDRDITNFDKATLEGYLFNPNNCGESKPNRNEIDSIRGFFNWLTGESPKTPIESPILTINPFRGWVSETKRDDETSIVIHSYDECKALLEEAATHRGQALVAWMLHSGMRPTESVRFWNDPAYGWNNIDLEQGLIFVPAKVSKVRKPREIDISPTLRQWLEFYRDRKSFFEFASEKAWTFKYVQIRNHLFGAGFKAKDTVRHTRISVLVRLGIPLATVETQMGNSKDIIRNHYLRHMTEEEAKKIDSLTPDQVSLHDA